MYVAWCKTLIWLHASIHCQLQWHLWDRTYSQRQKVPRGQMSDKLRHVRNNACLLCLVIRVRKFEQSLFEIIFLWLFNFFLFNLTSDIFVYIIHTPSKIQSKYVRVLTTNGVLLHSISLRLRFPLHLLHPLRSYSCSAAAHICSCRVSLLQTSR